MHAQARALFDQLPGLDLVLASPLVRATQTAEILVSAFDLDTPVLASRVVSEPASVEHLARRIRDVHAPIGVVAVVGHEPTMSGLLEHLIGGASLGFRTGQAVLLEAGRDRFEPRGAWHGGAPVPL
jgi:phosphohistidine phosphatase SixA